MRLRPVTGVSWFLPRCRREHASSSRDACVARRCGACRPGTATPIIRCVPGSVIACVGAVIKDDEGRLLLIMRGHEPGAGLWSLPGGRIEPGETDVEALTRELAEETGLEVEAGHLLGRVQRPGRPGTILDIRDYTATVIGGTLSPGDDAADARWVDAAELNCLAVTDGLVEALTSWGVLSRQGVGNQGRSSHRSLGIISL